MHKPTLNPEPDPGPDLLVVIDPDAEPGNVLAPLAALLLAVARRRKESEDKPEEHAAAGAAD
jgi:MYXO-CTERM domain-containing protein